MKYAHAVKGFIVGATSFAVGMATAYASGHVSAPEIWGAAASSLTALSAYFGVAVAAPAYSSRQSGATAEPVDESAVEGMPVE